MSTTDLTIFNPQQISVDAVVNVPSLGLHSKRLAPDESWTISGGVASDQWVSFASPVTTEILAAALLPDNSTIAQLLLSVGVEGLLRMNAQEPLTASNGLPETVFARLWDVGAAAPKIRRLAPTGQVGSSTQFAFNQEGQWLEFFDVNDEFITGVGGNSFSEVTLKSPKQFYEIGNPYPVGLSTTTQLADGARWVTRPALEDDE